MGDDTFRAEWLTHPLTVIFAGVDRARRPMTVEVRVDGTPMTIESADGVVTLYPGSPVAPDAVLTGPPDLILGVLTGQLAADAATALGLDITGNVAGLQDLRPTAR